MYVHYETNGFKNYFCDVNVTGNFMECNIDELHNHLLFQENCYSNEIVSKPKITLGTMHKVMVLAKRPYQMEEIGFECKIKKKSFVYHTDFFLNHYTEGPFVEHVRLSRDDCIKLMYERKCNDKLMNCKSNRTCNFVEQLKSHHPNWIGTNQISFFECQFKERLVLGIDSKTSIFHDAIIPCTFSDAACLLPYSTVIWYTSSNIMQNNCPFENLVSLNNIQSIRLENGYDALVSLNENYLFEIVEEITECGLTMKTTSQGLYLVLDPNTEQIIRLGYLLQSKLKMQNFQEKDYRDLILAENDSKFMIFKKQLYKLACSVMLNAIKTQLNKDDTFLKVNFLGDIKFRFF